MKIAATVQTDLETIIAENIAELNKQIAEAETVEERLVCELSLALLRPLTKWRYETTLLLGAQTSMVLMALTFCEPLALEIFGNAHIEKRDPKDIFSALIAVIIKQLNYILDTQKAEIHGVILPKGGNA
jgi:hypothetical protein